MIGQPTNFQHVAHVGLNSSRAPLPSHHPPPHPAEARKLRSKSVSPVRARGEWSGGSGRAEATHGASGCGGGGGATIPSDQAEGRPQQRRPTRKDSRHRLLCLSAPESSDGESSGVEEGGRGGRGGEQSQDALTRRLSSLTQPPDPRQVSIGRPTNFQHIAHVGFNTFTNPVEEAVEAREEVDVEEECGRTTYSQRRGHQQQHSEVETVQLRHVDQHWASHHAPHSSSTTDIDQPQRWGEQLNHQSSARVNSVQLRIRQLEEQQWNREEHPPEWQDPEAQRFSRRFPVGIPEEQQYGSGLKQELEQVVQLRRAAHIVHESEEDGKEEDRQRKLDQDFHMGRQCFSRQEASNISEQNGQWHSSSKHAYPLPAESGVPEEEVEGGDWEGGGGDAVGPSHLPHDLAFASHTKLRKDMIGPPTNFRHVLHINPSSTEEDLQKLIDNVGLHGEQSKPRLQRQKSDPGSVGWPEPVSQPARDPPPRKASIAPRTACISKEMIAAPTNFQHVQHFGFGEHRVAGQEDALRGNMDDDHNQQDRAGLRGREELHNGVHHDHHHPPRCEDNPAYRLGQGAEGGSGPLHAPASPTHTSAGYSKEMIGPPTNFKHVAHIGPNNASQVFQGMTEQGIASFLQQPDGGQEGAGGASLDPPTRPVDHARPSTTISKAVIGPPTNFEHLSHASCGRPSGDPGASQEARVEEWPPQHLPAKIRKDMIGPPTNFQHVQHVGF